MSAVQRILDRLDSVKQTRPGSWRARCPGHNSRQRSLMISKCDDRILLYCHAACPTETVLSAINLSVSDLFERPLGHLLTRVQRPWNASDVLHLVLDEAYRLAVIASDLNATGALPSADADRIAQIGGRLSRLTRIVSDGN